MLEEILTLFREKDDFLITTHVHPDGDGIGAGLALLHLLEGLGKRVTYYVSHPVPYNLSFLPGADALVTTLPDDACFDATVIVDCAEESRCGPAMPDTEHRGQVVILDHHLPVRGGFGDLIFRDETASAVGEIVYFIARALERPVTPELATCVYCSIISDTGSFHYSNTTPTALRIAAEMVGVGVDPWAVASRLYETVPLPRIQLLKHVLGSLEIAAEGKAASICVTQDMLDAASAGADMIDGFINYARSIDGVEVAVQFQELPATDSGDYKISFRSRGRYNVAEVAAAHGGGGHHNAAGCTLSGALPDVKQRIYSAVEALVAESP